MEKHTTAKGKITRLLLVGFFAANSFGFVQAQQSPSKSIGAEIKYIGLLDSKLVFQVDYHNADQKSFSIEITDQDGFEFYSARFKQKGFVGRYAIDKLELGNNTISFTVLSDGKKVEQSFDVNTSLRLAEEKSVVKH